MHKVRIEGYGATGKHVRVYLDGIEVNGITELHLKMAVNAVNTITLTLYADVELAAELEALVPEENEETK